jgi:hypothetical protein
MNVIKFAVPSDVPASECHGNYIVRELTAQEGIDALNELIMQNAKLQENPDQITPQQYKCKILEKATTVNGQPFKLDLAKIPHKLYSVLLAANERLNSLSDNEARFLLKPSSSNGQPSIQQ